MKIDNQNGWETSGLVSKQIGVDPEAIGKLIGLLSRRMYSFPHSAFREAWLNARESHAKRALRDFPEDDTQGQAVTRPMEIVLPLSPRGYRVEAGDHAYGYRLVVSNPGADSNNNLRFSIRDYGVGLTATELEALITNAGRSDKTDDNNLGGGMGIGSLAGFSVADQIVYTAFKDGYKSTLVLSSESNAFVASDPVATDEEDGVQLSYVIRDSATAEAFTEGAAQLLAMAPVDERAVIICDPTAAFTLSNRQGKTGPRRVTGLHLLDEAPAIGSSDSLNIRIDGCFYRGEHSGLADKISNAIDSHAKNLHKNISTSGYSSYANAVFSRVIWDVTPGYFQGISPNRETISLTKAEVDTFIGLLIDYLDEFFDLAVKSEKLFDALRNTSDVNEELDKLREIHGIMSHPAFKGASRYRYSRNDVKSSSVYKSNFNDEVTPEVIAARMAGIPYVGSITSGAPRGTHFKLTNQWETPTGVSTMTAHRLPGGVIGRAHTVKVGGVDYSVDISTYRGAEKIISLNPLSFDEDKTLIRVASSSNQLNQAEWENRIENLSTASVSKLSAEEKALVKKVIDKNAEVIVSVPAAKEIESILTGFGLTVDTVGEEVDGVALRKVYSKLFASKRKANATKYNVALSKSAIDAVGSVDLADADTINEFGITVLRAEIDLGGRYKGVSKSLLLSAAEAQYGGPVAFVFRRGQQQSEDRMVESVKFQGKVSELDDSIIIRSLNLSINEIVSNIGADSIMQLSNTNGAIDAGVTSLPEFRPLSKHLVGSRNVAQPRVSWSRRNDVAAVLNSASKEALEKIAAEKIGVTVEGINKANKQARAVLDSVNLNSVGRVLDSETIIVMVKTVLDKAEV